MKKILITLFLLFFIVAQANALQISNEARLEYNKGVDYYRLGQYENAVTAFRRAIDISPDYIDAYYNLGTILEYLEQNEAALAVFKQIIVRYPNDYESVYKAAVISEKLGKVAEAQNYISIIPKDAPQYDLAIELSQKLRTVNTPSSTPKTAVTTPPNNGSFLYENVTGPTGMVTDDAGNLYIAGFTDNIITKVLTNGKRVIFVKGQKLNGPIGMAIDVYGNLYVANYNSNNVLKITKNGEMSVLIGNLKKPYGLYLTGKMLYVSLQGSNSVLRYKLPD